MVYLIAFRWIVTWHHLNGMVHISSVMMHFLNTPIHGNILIEIMEISALLAELHNDGFNNRNVVVVIRERYANRVSLFSICNRNGFEGDIDGVLV
ncbi:hypothetical protein OUZ56_004478 [Daphnia magna]|uniref:Uncharacterized protein n=1 Tax=Daphnia magna TaxID=35525 RepID=A0ABQ9YQ54_9CRUS|nr:hypothetical protein OUZ56_004478 [Daphnia magna]